MAVRSASLPLQSPFLTHSLEPSAHSDGSATTPVMEDVSDGLTIRRCYTWFCPSYTRKDCRCGSCSIGDTDPCPYARPPSTESMVSSVLSVGKRSLSRVLSLRAADKDV